MNINNFILTSVRSKLCVVLCSWLLSVPMVAQVVYQCDFEDAAECAQWQMNMGANAALIARLENKWYIHSSGQHGEGGQNGLLLSYNGTDAAYTNSRPSIVYAYREITLQPGEYKVSFDWRCNTSALSGEGMYVCLVPVSDQTVKLNSGAQALPEWVSRYVLPDSPDVLGGAATWQLCNSSYTALASQGTTYRLIFVWFQNGTHIVSTPSAMVDNISIKVNDDCLPPSGITYSITASSLDLSWRGTANWYDVKVYDYNEDRWQIFDHVVGKRLSVGNLSEGVLDVYIRSHCGDNTSEYVLIKPFYFIKGNRCIEYMALDDPTKCRCYTGGYDNQRETVKSLRFDDLLHGLWSLGQPQEAPLFSLHYMPDEYDPNTDNKLLTKPVDATASVRLGRFEPTFGACTEYTYTVPDGDKAILMLRYAVVLPNPHPGEDNVNPKFKLEILANNKHIHDSCGIADFMAGFGDAASWNESQSSGQPVLWKDWTELAINLREYVGQRITVRLMTTGCGYSAHGGYAYYTLTCEDGTLTGINCGDIPTTQFVAPAGFDYAWYLPDHPEDILGTSQIYEVDPMDTLTYNVDVISRNNGRCYYTLDACGIPRYPVAEATVEKASDHCENTVIFHQTCHVKYKNQVTEHEWHTDVPVETVVWDFGDGSPLLSTTNEYVMHTYPDQGGTYTATLTAGIVGDLCQTSSTVPVQLPDIYREPFVVHADVCEGKCFLYNGVYYCNTYKDTLYYESVGGCDSTVIFDIIMHERNHTAKAGLCEGEGFEFGGETLYEPGTYSHTFQSSFGCDSVVTLSLDVEPKLVINMPDTAYTCFGDRAMMIDYELVQGNLDSVAIRFDRAAQALGLDSVYIYYPGDEIVIPWPTATAPCRVEAEVNYYTPFCPAPGKRMVLEIRYNTSVFTQNKGVLELMNQDHNGGYEFVSYQWYRDGEPIPDATYPYLAMADQDLGHTYSVLVTRSGDNIALQTCEVVYQGAPQALDEVSSSLQQINVYTILGHYIGSIDKIDEVRNLPIGVYILNDGKHVYKTIR